MQENLNKKQKVALLNLGCKVNQYESDAILNNFKNGYETTTNLEFADIYIVNTCAVTLEAEKKSRQILAKIEKLNSKAKIYVCGCASQNNPRQFLNKKQVEFVSGTFGKGKIKDNLQKKGNQIVSFSKDYEDDLFVSNVRTRAYLKIQDGCNNFCSYCLIPFLRGNSRSRKLDSIVKEAKELSKITNEIVLTGINISDYKIDGKPALSQVMKALYDLPCRVRISSLEVSVIDEKFLSVLKRMPNFCPHFHLSLQSGSDKVLREMNRHYSTKIYLDKVFLIRKFFDEPALTTDLIVGYPTETEEDFLTTLKFLKTVKFFNVHYFAYSTRKGTKAGKLSQLNGKVIKERQEKLKEVVFNLKNQYLKKFLKKPLEVLVELKKGEYFEGFSQNYIKCYFCFPVETGSIVKVIPQSLFKNGLLCKKA